MGEHLIKVIDTNIKERLLAYLSSKLERFDMEGIFPVYTCNCVSLLIKGFEKQDYEIHIYSNKTEMYKIVP